MKPLFVIFSLMLVSLGLVGQAQSAPAINSETVQKRIQELNAKEQILKQQERQLAALKEALAALQTVNASQDSLTAVQQVIDQRSEDVLIVKKDYEKSVAEIQNVDVLAPH